MNSFSDAEKPPAAGATVAPVYPEGRFQSRETFQQLVREAFEMAAREGWKELWLSDASFADWPLGERAVIESLNTWIGPGRRLTLLAQQYDDVVRRHARFVSWRSRWDHCISCRRLLVCDAAEVPSVIWSPHWMLERIDVEHCIGVSTTLAGRRVALQENLNGWVQRKSTLGFPSSTLGL